MNRILYIVFPYILFLILLRTNAYKNPRFSSLSTNSEKSISEDLNKLYKINEELVTNEREDEDEDEDDQDELQNSNFEDIAHKSLENAEEEATVDLENAEIENLLDEEIYRIVQERLKKLWYIGKCRRDYTNICPIDWNVSAYDKNLCIPPEKYEGECRSIDFSKSTHLDKELFSWKCEVEWPCISAPKLKIMDKCPFRWTYIDNNLCIAPEDYIGHCSPAMDFSNYNYEMRIRWANECNVEWDTLPTSEYIPLRHKKLTTNVLGGPVEESGNVMNITNKN
ncbi:CPW-WPC family protein [Plasmodium gaboni]|uniref:CPW-WPC family protein n=1 Tax=Plasmodium gaboni TaxID=647221 RepID=A0A151LS26_9APIC|nr:CPW-WPC family protein [Plasmodium gaboni]KYO01997.1 CPW-WPC family protein [Plasmodium gaboni]